MLAGTKEDVDGAFERIKTMRPCTKLLPLYSILLFDYWNEAIRFIKKVIEESTEHAMAESVKHLEAMGRVEAAENLKMMGDLNPTGQLEPAVRLKPAEYLELLIQSKHFIQRKSVPVIIRGTSLGEKKKLLLESLSDETVPVVKEACITIMEDRVFEDSELVGIAELLFSRPIMNFKTMSVDVLSMVRSRTVLIGDLIKSCYWKIRYEITKRYAYFPEDQKGFIISELIDDKEECIRAELAKNIHTLEYLHLMKDPSEEVRMNYLINIVNKITDLELLRSISEDPSWNVKIILLRLKGEYFKEISIPLIKLYDDPIKWRNMLGILDNIENRIFDDSTARNLLDFVVKTLKHKVAFIRKKASHILVSLIEKYDWIGEYEGSFLEIVLSTNYLHRMAILPPAIEFDMKFHRWISDHLKNDKLQCVRNLYDEYIADCWCQGDGNPTPESSEIIEG